MGYLTRASGLPNFSKAVFSLWFRVPQASIDAASAEEIPASDTELVRTIPLLTYGPRLTKKTYPDLHSEDVHIDHWDTSSGLPGASDGFFTLTPTSYGDSSTAKISPCFIGLECSGGVAKLTFNIQMSDYADVAGLIPGVLVVDRYLQQSLIPPENPLYSSSITDPGTGTPGSGWEAGPSPEYSFTTLWDRTPIDLNAQPEVFTVQTGHAIAAGQWHHLLLSFDLSDPCVTTSPGLGDSVIFWDTVPQGTSSYCKLWYAIDDVNYSGGANMKPYPVDYNITDGIYGTGDIGDPNGILTANAWNIVQGSTGYIYNVLTGPSTCSYTTPPIPASGAALGIPSSSAFVDHIYDVDMAEGQIFTGVTLDTSILGNRRLFVTGTGFPTAMSVAAAVLGQPKIKLHGQRNWLAGKNTGSLGGTLTRTATINPFLPSPSLS